MEQTGQRPVVIWQSGALTRVLQSKIRNLDESEMEELELATDEALGRVEPM
jgi:mRNA-degrading endonuclease toxin of MazEF toxin-antitoxin module